MEIPTWPCQDRGSTRLRVETKVGYSEHPVANTLKSETSVSFHTVTWSWMSKIMLDPGTTQETVSLNSKTHITTRWTKIDSNQVTAHQSSKSQTIRSPKSFLTKTRTLKKDPVLLFKFSLQSTMPWLPTPIVPKQTPLTTRAITTSEDLWTRHRCTTIMETIAKIWL